MTNKPMIMFAEGATLVVYIAATSLLQGKKKTPELVEASVQGALLSVI